MSNTLGMAAQLAGESLRFGWYFALNRVVEWRTSQLGLARRYKPSRPVPSMQELLAEQAHARITGPRRREAISGSPRVIVGEVMRRCLGMEGRVSLVRR